MFSVLDIENQFSKQKINKAKKLVIRELDQEQKNHFVCFVDEENESFDVQIYLNQKSEITNSSCDCGNDDFCLHKLALAINLSDRKSGVAPKRGKTKKISEAVMAMENLNSEEMKLWLLEFFKKNKDAEVQFLLEFGEKKNDFSDDEIKEIINKTIQSVAGKKKNITAPEIKKIVDLLTKSLEPVEEFLWKNISKPVSLDYFLFINEQLVNYLMTIFTTSNRIDKFLEKFKEKFALQFNHIQDDALWKNLAKKYWNYFLKGDGKIPFHQYQLLLEIYHSGSSKQKLYIAELVKNEILYWLKNNFKLQVELRSHLLEIVAENDFFVETKAFFPIVRYENSYNIKILNELSKTDKQQTEELCKTIIDSNSNEKYNYPYYEILEKNYLKDNDFLKLAYIKKKKFASNPNLADYIFIAENESDNEEFKKFRNKTLANLRKLFYGNPHFVELYFKILESEKNYAKMLDIFDGYISADILMQYIDQLYLVNKEQLFNCILKRFQQLSSREKEKELVLLDWFIANYNKELFYSYLKKNRFIYNTFYLDLIKNKFETQ